MTSQIHRLFFLFLLTVTGTNAGLLDSLFGLDGDTEEGDPGVFYQEDRLANVAMMVDFANTPLYLVALFKWRDQALFEDGRATNLTGFEADRLYTQAMFSDIVPGVGGEAKFIANVQQTNNLISDNDANEFHADWDAMAVIEFPNGLAFASMLPQEKFIELSPFKKAGLEFHSIFACELMPDSSMGPAGFNDPTEDAIAVVDLLEYRLFANYQEGDEDASRWRSGQDAAYQYLYQSTPQAVDLGMRRAATFKIKQNLILGASGVSGWDEVRINTYPSQAAWESFKAEPNLGWHHMEAGARRMSELELGPMFFNSLGGNAQIGYYDACAAKALEEESEETLIERSAPTGYDMSSFCP